ncbi:MAG: AcrR family transcriptional regulator [Myxococcota bacterium]|jgi:AcrR family transcriptional regulator
MSAEAAEATENPKHAIIHSAAIVVFSARGFAGTSMSHIADEAGMSRPALYQYFRNKGDIFASAIITLVENAADRSMAALLEPGSLAEQLDSYLQRFEGDLWERMSASNHGEEILSAKTEYAPRAMVVVMARMRDGLEQYLRRSGAGGRSAAAIRQRTDWMEILEFAPKGFKFDQPSVPAYRRRLTALAQSIAADIAAT